MNRHFSRRPPAKDRRFSWVRTMDQDAGFVTYRLYRKAMSGRVFVESRTFWHADPRPAIALTLRAMRRRLLDAVDAVDLAALGLEQAA